MTPEHLQKLQDLFRIGPENPITLRAIRKELNLPTQNLHFHAADYPAVEDRWSAFAAEAKRLNVQGYNIYTCMNPIKPDFAEEAVGDEHIVSRTLLLVDLDRAETQEVPATDDEVKRIFDVSEKVVDWFHEQKGVEPIRVLSGNGVHLYYRLDNLPNDQDSRSACRGILAELGSLFDTAEVKVDRVVHNASRITKVPGTIAYKGKAESDDRPFRGATFL